VSQSLRRDGSAVERQRLELGVTADRGSNPAVILPGCSVSRLNSLFFVFCGMLDR